MLVAVAAMAMLGGISVPSGPASAGHQSGPYFDLDAFEAPDYTGKQIFDGLKQFVADYPARITGTPNEIRSGMALHQELDELGYDAQTVTLGQNEVLASNPDGTGAGLKVIMGKKTGTTRPNDWIMFIGHYDSIATTVDGAYDNGAGTNFIRFLAHEFKDIPTNRSLVFAFYNAEEEGLLASARHAAALKNAGQQITAVLGFDMVGIAWPVANETSRNCLCMWRGPNDAAAFDPLMAYVNYDYLGFPNANTKVKMKGPNNRNSDERSFANQGYPTMRWAGMHSASNYVAYHEPEDTIATIISEAGGEEYYEAGVHNTLKSVYYTALALDNHAPEPAFTSSVSGLTASLDATLSTDADGSLTGFSWDFGDGTTGVGATASHTYAGAGSYTVTLTVADNLHPQVTRSATALVTVG